MRMSEDIREEIAGIARRLEDQLKFYREIGITDIGGAGSALKPAAVADSRVEVVSIANSSSTQPTEGEIAMPKKNRPIKQTGLFGDTLTDDLATAPPNSATLPVIKAQDISLEAIREDIGECVRCKLHEHRNNIVFGEGNPK